MTTAAVHHPPASITPPQLARRWGVDAGKVLALIRSGQLRAVNLALAPGGRPRYRIRESDIIAFEESRTTRAPLPRQSRRRPQVGGRTFF